MRLYEGDVGRADAIEFIAFVVLEGRHGMVAHVHSEGVGSVRSGQYHPGFWPCEPHLDIHHTIVEGCHDPSFKCHQAGVDVHTAVDATGTHTYGPVVLEGEPGRIPVHSHLPEG